MLSSNRQHSVRPIRGQGLAGDRCVTITTREAATRAGVTLRGLRYWIERYPGLGARVGGRWRVSVDALDAILRGAPPAVSSEGDNGKEHDDEEGEGRRSTAG